ncbi:16S rRNA processing protein RimM [uncultured Alistipes sp.]|uniref:ribosome maturation factor RimM n=1 Tax=uncultured Alistipes sp. TaxID=538949 RepID=UPI002607C157|nr:16S rRNA processing protein RimM [uncultured Alistipes sp.]
MKTPAGRINRLFGTEGGVMLSLYAPFPDDFAPATTPLFVTIDGLEVPLWCSRFERRGQTGAVAAFDDLDTERRAEELLGLEFRIEVTEEAAADDEFYMEDLIGFEAEAELIAEEQGAHRTVHGRLADYYDSEANPLFELELEGRAVLVPAAEEFIARIDFEGRRIKFVLPEGLIDLQTR